MNTIFSYFKEKPIQSITDLCNEFTLYQLMISIEPNLKKNERINRRRNKKPRKKN